MDMMAVCSKMHANQINSLFGYNIELLSIEPGGM